MARPEILRNIRTNLTLSAADTYTEVEINLALSLESRFLYFVTDIFVMNSDQAITSGDIWEWQITRRTQAALVNYSNSNVLWKGGHINLLTTSGMSTVPLQEHISLNHPYAIAMPSLFFGADSAGAGSALDFSLNIQYFPMKVTQAQFWEASQTR